MAETTIPQDKPVEQAPDEFESKFKARLKEKYGIEDDPDAYKTKREKWTRAEEELPQYQSTLNALIEHIKAQEAQQVQQPVKGVEDDEERLRTIAKLDPYEGAKRYFAKKEQELEEKFKKVSTEASQQSQAQVLHREGLRRAHEIVTQQWPEAFDQSTDLHKMGRQIFQQEMSPMEQQHPMAFLHATERAAGRVGLAPKNRRTTSRRADVSAQSVSRDKVKSPDLDEDTPLNSRQKEVIEKMGIDEKTYRLAKKNRDKKKDEEQD